VASSIIFKVQRSTHPSRSAAGVESLTVLTTFKNSATFSGGRGTSTTLLTWANGLDGS